MCVIVSPLQTCTTVVMCSYLLNWLDVSIKCIVDRSHTHILKSINMSIFFLQLSFMLLIWLYLLFFFFRCFLFEHFIDIFWYRINANWCVTFRQNTRWVEDKCYILYIWTKGCEPLMSKKLKESKLSPYWFFRWMCWLDAKKMNKLLFTTKLTDYHLLLTSKQNWNKKDAQVQQFEFRVSLAGEYQTWYHNPDVKEFKDEYLKKKKIWSSCCTAASLPAGGSVSSQLAHTKAHRDSFLLFTENLHLMLVRQQHACTKPHVELHKRSNKELTVLKIVLFVAEVWRP